MKKIFFALFISSITLVSYAQNKKTIIKKTTVVTPNVLLKTQLDSASYAFGSSIGSGLKLNGLNNLNYETFVKGLKDAFAGVKLLVDEQKSQQVINAVLSNANKTKYIANLNEGKVFLEQNKKHSNIHTTASGLQYEIILPGNGLKPKATDTVLVHYKGTLLNGKQFDSSYDRGEPVSFPLNRVIAGWTEGVQLMSTGSKYKFYVPYNLGYGERGYGENIPPYSTLVFEVELLKVNGK